MGQSGFNRLDERMQRWVWRQGWSALKPVQENAVDAILSADRDVIISAPTAGGKTEAAYLPILTNLLATPVAEGYAVLNISPLKALVNDQTGRLSHLAEAAGDDLVTVTPWHGDVAPSMRQRSLRDPRGILIITPESLESIFINHSDAVERVFKALRYVVVDELYAFMGSERGVQLQSQLTRLEAVTGCRVPRIALSATIADPAAAAAFLRPGRDTTGYPVAFPDAGDRTHRTLISVKEFVADGTGEYDKATAADLFKRLRGSSNLVFTNSRKQAEALALQLRDMSAARGVPDEFMLHHGSLSRAGRDEVEQRLRDHTRPATVICTSTLELGVDIGQVTSIAQIGAAGSVSALRQRLGRSGRRDAPAVLRVYSLDEKRDDYKYMLRTGLVQNIAVVELLSKGIYEMPCAGAPHYSTLIQQLLSVTAAHGAFRPAEAWRLLCRDGAFYNVDASRFMLLLKALGEKGVLAPLGRDQITVGQRGEQMLNRHDFYTAFVSIKDLSVRDLSTGRVVGAVQYMPYVGEYILLDARRWLVEQVDEGAGTVGVKVAHTTGKMMFEGFGQEVDGIIAGQMKVVYESADDYAFLDGGSGAPHHLARARDNYRRLGLDKNPVITVGDRPLLFTWGGMRLNRTLALMVKSTGRPMPEFDPYAVADVPPGWLTEPPVADLTTLAALVPRGRKLLGKHDHLLPDILLNQQYALTSLTLPGSR